MLTRKDWVLRQVKQLADFIARALGLAAQQRQPEATALLRTAGLELLGLELSSLEWVDAASAVDLLGSSERGLTFARLLEALAEVEGAPGGEARLRYAAEVALELQRRYPGNAEVKALAARLVPPPGA